MTVQPIERKDLHVPFAILAARGFEALPLDRARERSDIRDLPAMVRHPLNAMADLRDGYSFAEFEDEMIPFVRDGLVLDLFATRWTHAFLFVGREDGRVHWDVDWSPDGSGPTFEVVNTSLTAFARCFCRETSICFRWRAELVGAPAKTGDDFDGEAAARDEAELRAFLEATDPVALGSVYWSTVLGELGEGFYKPLPTTLHLLARERWRKAADPQGD